MNKLDKLSKAFNRLALKIECSVGYIEWLLKNEEDIKIIKRMGNLEARQIRAKIHGIKRIQKFIQAETELNTYQESNEYYASLAETTLKGEK